MHLAFLWGSRGFPFRGLQTTGGIGGEQERKGEHSFCGEYGVGEFEREYGRGEYNTKRGQGSLSRLVLEVLTPQLIRFVRLCVMVQLQGAGSQPAKLEPAKLELASWKASTACLPNRPFWLLN